MAKWITDRQPTEADANEGQAVLVCNEKNQVSSLRWSLVPEGFCWAHYDLPPTPMTALEKAAASVERCEKEVTKAISKHDILEEKVTELVAQLRQARVAVANKRWALGVEQGKLQVLSESA